MKNVFTRFLFINSLWLCFGSSNFSFFFFLLPFFFVFLFFYFRSMALFSTRCLFFCQCFDVEIFVLAGFCRPLTSYNKRESCASSATTTTLLGPPSSYASQRGSNGALHLYAMPRAISPLMQVSFSRLATNIIWQTFSTPLTPAKSMRSK